MNTPTKNQGFTLIELLIALLLTSLLMSAIGGLLWQVSSSLSHTQNVRQEAVRLNALFDQFTQDVYAYHSDYTPISDTELIFTILKDDSNTLSPTGSLYAVQYKIQNTAGQTQLIRSEKALSLRTKAIKSIVWDIDNPKQETYITLGHWNAHTALPAWIDSNQPPYGVQLRVQDSRGHNWVRNVPLLAGHQERL